jgi:two-component sensor histidine kinase
MSLLSLQSKTLKDSSAVDMLIDAKNRLQSIEVLYGKLCKSENFRELSINDYLPPLIDEIAGVFSNREM